MIFECQSGKPACDGSLLEKIFDKISQIDPHQNIGWELINNNEIAESCLVRLSTEENQELLENIKFLNP
jgi:hypothetical protein